MVGLTMAILVGGAIGAPGVFAADQTTGQSTGILQKLQQFGLGGMLSGGQSGQGTTKTTGLAGLMSSGTGGLSGLSGIGSLGGILSRLTGKGTTGTGTTGAGATGTSSAAASESASDTTSESASDATSDTTTSSSTSTTEASDSPSSTGDMGCTATYSAGSSWSDGFQGNITVKAGSAAITGWKVSWPLDSGQQITQGGKAKLTTSGSTVTATNQSSNGALAAGASTRFGFTASGPAGKPTLSCTAS